MTGRRARRQAGIMGLAGGLVLGALASLQFGLVPRAAEPAPASKSPSNPPAAPSAASSTAGSASVAKPALPPADSSAAASASAAKPALPPADSATAGSASVAKPALPPAAGSPAAPVKVVARTGLRRLEVADSAAPGGFRRIFVKGINMGVALPGRFPAEFPQDEASYLSWLELVSEMGANTVRLYTLLPPSFYSALDRHNRKHPDRKLWLVQGVWTELPRGDDYADPAFEQEFRKEIQRVVDAVHGNLDQPARRGHAHGSYRADVSSSVLSFLLGREWEPYSVEEFDRRTGGSRTRDVRGEYIRASPGRSTRFERWIAAMLDFTVSRDTERYRQQRPVSFVNWPTLDPLAHPTESTVSEERALLGLKGLRPDHPIHEYDNDAVSVDATHIEATAAAGGGIYATYHAYPYYPDFMNLDPGYNKARSSLGASNYIAYLRDLARHHGGQPILIAEVGVPSSRGIAHFQAQGWNHGGHTEREQGAINARLMEEIGEAGMAGGILFSLFDEWFKRNWLVIDFEVPYERNPLWLNILDPEQNFGLLATRPGASGWKVVIDGRGDDWKDVKPLATNAGRRDLPSQAAPAPPAGRQSGGVRMAPRVGPGAPAAESEAPRAASAALPVASAAPPIGSAAASSGTAAGGTARGDGGHTRAAEDGPGPERPIDDGHDAARALRAISATSDEAYLYLRLDVERLDADGDGSADWGQTAYLIGIDTYDAERGDRRLPIRNEKISSPAGLEFCLILDGPGTGRLLVDRPYDIETHLYKRPFQSAPNDDGEFMEMYVETNRERIARDGTSFPAKGYSRSPLRYGSMDPREADYDSLAEWKASIEGNFIEIRIGWGLLNVTDPSSRRVLQDNPSDLRTVGTVRTPGFRFYAASVKPEGPPGQQTPLNARLADRLPSGEGLRAADLPIYTWREWNLPSFRIEKKDSYTILRKSFDAMPSYPATP